jgi:hypothetical protein
MRLQFVRGCLLLAIVVTISAWALAQEGHPLTGTWYGNFGMATGPRHDLTVVMKWDGSTTTGTVNPGPNAVPLKTATLDVTLGKAGGRGTPAVPPTFAVHFELDAKNKTGGMDHFVFDGKIENPVAGNRRIVGTWTCGNTKGDFVLRRT